jgi:multidrug resistance protein, MATE family
MLAGLLALAIAAALFAARSGLASVYASSPAVVALAASLLGWVALYHLFDAMQALSVLLLRCYRITVAPLVTYCLLLWAAGLGGGYVLAYRGLGSLPAQESPAAFWIASAASLALVAMILPAILWRAAHRDGP